MIPRLSTSTFHGMYDDSVDSNGTTTNILAAYIVLSITPYIFCRPVWIQTWQMQCVLTGSQVHWTREIEACHARLSAMVFCCMFNKLVCLQDALAKHGAAGLPAVHGTCLQQLQDLVKLIRSPLPAVTVMCLSSLAVLDVHSRDITQQL